MEEKINEFQKNRGIILSHAVDVEQFLEFFISNYFVRPQSQKTFFFKREVAQKMNFEKKVELFKEICKREKCDQEKLNEVVNSIKFVQELRNKVAHLPMLVNPLEDKVSLMNKRSKQGELNLELTEELISKVAKEREKANEGIIDFYNQFNKNGPIDGQKAQAG